MLQIDIFYSECLPIWILQLPLFEALIIYRQVFFRAGVLGMMEEIREEKIAQILGWLQAVVRGHMSRVTYQKLKAQKVTTLKSQQTSHTYIKKRAKDISK